MTRFPFTPRSRQGFFLRAALVVGSLLTVAVDAAVPTVPFTFVNRSTTPDDQVYVAVVGITQGHVWIDPATSQVKPMSPSDNSMQGPVIGGNKGPGNNGLYANAFRKLSEIPGGVVRIPELAGSRIFVSFGSPLYLYFFGYSGAPSGYAGVNLANPTDPNQGIRFEVLELTNNQYGMWANTTRVDAYQFPMGLEVFGGNNFQRRTGEIVGHQEILSKWKSSVSSAFQGCLSEKEGIIHAPSKIAAFQPGGAQADFFRSYVDAIWEKYRNEDLIFSSGDAGVWKGRVVGERFEFKNLTNMHGNATAYISRRPNTQEVLEGKGVLAEDVQKLPTQTLDLVVQAQFCAALNRHALDLDAPAGTTQDFGDTARYFKKAPYNEYVKFWHRPDVSWNRYSYGFCYDDVFDQSSTIHTPSPTAATVTIGGYPAPVSAGRRSPVGVQCGVRLDSDKIRLVGEGFEAGHLSLRSASGALLERSQATAGEVRLDRPLGSGTYLWTLENGRQSGSGTLVVP